MKKWLMAMVCGGVMLNAWAATTVRMETSLGNIDVVLDEQRAPKTVANFVSYANSGAYNGTIFHRVIDGFMIQGGGFDAKMVQKSTKAPIANEANNGLKNDVYTIAMARTSAPHSATNQFFINVNNNTALNYKGPTPAGAGYAVFGKVSDASSKKVVDKIAKVATKNFSGHQNVPVNPIVIKKVTVLKTH